MALWKHIIDVSVTDLRKIYTKLNVDFDLWKKESDAQPYIPDMVQRMKDGGYAHLDDGATCCGCKRRDRYERNPAVYDLEIEWCDTL